MYLNLALRFFFRILFNKLMEQFKARFHYERENDHSVFLLLIFPCLKLKRALSKEKKINKTSKV